jgi:predicted nucleotidyltransferase
MRELNRQTCFNKGQIKDYFVQQDDIDFVLIFGSAALGRDTSLSDFDIAFVMSPWNLEHNKIV